MTFLDISMRKKLKTEASKLEGSSPIPEASMRLRRRGFRLQGSGFRKEAVAGEKIASGPMLTCRNRSMIMAPVLVDP
jgi:hypothetical protein